jgi:uncharacterized RDD family membrane protein YckC
MRIETPEQIGVDLELAGLGSRFVAQFVDWCIKLVITIVLVLIGAFLLMPRGQEVENLSPIVAASVISVLYLLWLGYGVYFEVRRNGQTPGKRFARIRVVKQHGGALDARAGFIRNLLAIADFLPAFNLNGALLILLTANRQRLGDLAAGTVVIRERLAGAGELPEETDELLEWASDDYAFSATHLAALTPDDRQIIRSYLQRYRSLNPNGREKLGFKLVDGYVEKMSYPLRREVVDAADAREFLASLLRDYQEHLRHR